MYRVNLLMIIVTLIVVMVMYSSADSTDTWSKYKGNRPERWFKVLASVFGNTKKDDNGIGAGGVNLFNFPYTRRINDRFGTRKIYPIAMYTSDIGYYKYSILEIRNGKKRIFAQVVDECADGDCHKNNKKAKRRNRKLIDIHKTAFRALGVNDGLTKMKARMISKSKRNIRDTQMRSVLTSDGKRGWVKSNWK